MQIFKILLVMLLTLSLSAKELMQKVQQKSIETLVQQIKNATPQNKRVLINQLKQQLREKNKATRLNVMMDLKKSFSHDKKLSSKKQNRVSRKNSSKSFYQDRKARQPLPRFERKNHKKGKQ